MHGAQIDSLCRDAFSESYGKELASDHTSYSLVIPMWNTLKLNDASETLRHVLRLAFCPTRSFGTTAYHEASSKSLI
jgi:hypothetical protein